MRIIPALFALFQRGKHLLGLVQVFDSVSPGLPSFGLFEKIDS